MPGKDQRHRYGGLPEVQFLTDKRDGVPYLEAKDFRSFAVYEGLDLGDCNAFEAQLSSPPDRWS